MPCEQVRKIEVNLNASDKATMLDALLLMKLGPMSDGDLIYFGNQEWINTKTGQAKLSWNRNVNEIKQAYSRQIVQRQAKRFGWTLNVNPANQNEIQIIKR